MAKKNTKKAAKSGEKEAGRGIPERFRTWTWEDFAGWTDARSVQRGKGYVGNVSDVAVGKDGEIIATVSGTRNYVTEIRVDSEGRVEGRCSCPVGHRCKHAVALILKCIEMLESGRTLPPLGEYDWRWARLDGDDDDMDEEEYEDEDKGGEEDREEEGDMPFPPRRTDSGRGALDAFVESLSATEAKRLLKSIIGNHRDVRAEVERHLRKEQGNAGELLRAARRELASASQEFGYSHPWARETFIPDYSKLRKTLERLRALKAGRELAEFGWRLIEETYEQIIGTDDEGETADEVGFCLAVVAAAVREASDIPEEDKLRWFYEMDEKSEYVRFSPEDDPVKHPEQWSPAAWSALADDLARKFATAQQNDDEEEDYRREHLLASMTFALEHAGRNEESRMARITYFRQKHRFNALAKVFLGAGNLDEAWDTASRAAHESDGANKGTLDEESLPQLRKTLRDIARARKDERMALAIQAEDFFSNPSASAFRELLAAAEPSGLATVLRASLIHFLETGERPTCAKRGGWPLEASGIPENPSDFDEPKARILLEIALMENNPDDILRRWRELPTNLPKVSWGCQPYDYLSASVADALAVAHPEVSLKIWEDKIRKKLPETGKYAYEQIADLLRKARGPMAALGREVEWESRVRELCGKYKRRRLFVEMLDELLGSERPILGSRKR